VSDQMPRRPRRNELPARWYDSKRTHLQIGQQVGVALSKTSYGRCDPWLCPYDVSRTR
jgi:hypothetical protein